MNPQKAGTTLSRLKDRLAYADARLDIDTTISVKMLRNTIALLEELLEEREGVASDARIEIMEALLKTKQDRIAQLEISLEIIKRCVERAHKSGGDDAWDR